jgi:hypothetical protein
MSKRTAIRLIADGVSVVALAASLKMTVDQLKAWLEQE